MNVVRFLVFSNSWIALGASSLGFLTFMLFDVPVSFSLLVFLFFSTLFSYNLQRISRLKTLKKTSPKLWVISHKQEAQILLIISLIGGIYFVPIFANVYSYIWLLLLGSISLGYSIKKLRDIPYFKIVFIASSWAIFTGIIPLLLSPDNSLVDFILSFGWIFFYAIAITIPFDIRDLAIDEVSKKTIPQAIGVKGSKLFAIFSLIISLLFLYQFVDFTLFLFFLASHSLAALAISFSYPTKGELYFSFLIDGHIIFQFIGVYFLC